MWSQSSQMQDVELAKQAIYLWGALEMEEELLSKIQSNSWSELCPTCVKVIIQSRASDYIKIVMYLDALSVKL